LGSADALAAPRAARFVGIAVGAHDDLSMLAAVGHVEHATTWMSSHARTQRVQRMQVVMSWRIIGSPGRSSPERSARSRPVSGVGSTS